MWRVCFLRSLDSGNFPIFTVFLHFFYIPVRTLCNIFRGFSIACGYRNSFLMRVMIDLVIDAIYVGEIVTIFGVN